MQALQAFFNSRFEFYGRKLDIVIAPFSDSNETSQRALAVKADEEAKVFASTYYQQGGGVWYHTELARRGIVSVMGPEMTFHGSEYMAAAPHLWSYLMSADRMFASIGDWTCDRLAGRPPTHALGLPAATRVFGVVHIPTQYMPVEVRPKITAALQHLKACGVEPKVVSDSMVAGGRDLATPMQNLVLQLQQAGVTSVVCLCYWGALHYLHQYATNNAYTPEWLVSSYANSDTNLPLKITLGPASPPDQMGRTFGVTFRPRQVALEQEPYNWALNETSPGLRNDPSNRDLNHVWANREFYRSLLLLASGVQMAGPRLTPATFEQALRRTGFPNPPHPNMAGAVGFDSTSHSMTTDGAEWWWSNTATSPYEGDTPGTVCYVDAGARRTPSRWPTQGDPFFSGTCDGGV